MANLPTPLVLAERFSEAIGAEVWLKRDDLTGIGLGGNKARSVEYHLGAARATGSDVFVTGGGPRSNWVLTAAAGAASQGLPCYLVLFGNPPTPGSSAVDLLDRLDQVRLIYTGNPVPASVDPMLEEVKERLEGQGLKPYVVGRGGAGPVGALGYLTAVDEIERQAHRVGFSPEAIWLSVGSCGTMAGLVAGYKRRPNSPVLVGATVHRPLEECAERIERISEAALDLIGQTHRHPVGCLVNDQLNPDRQQVEEAARLMAATEGIFLDPEFGATALADLIEKAGMTNGKVLFLVTGGLVNLFYGPSAS